MLRRWRELVLQVAISLLVALPAFATISNISGFTTQADGNVITASLWNAQIGGIYTYINANILPSLNALTTKGDIFGYNGSTIVRRAVGTDGQFLTANSANADGLGWSSPATTTALTTKGDILTYNGSTLARQAVGTDGQVLTAASGQTNGIQWQTVTTVPPGAILLWSGSIGSIPAGYVLCDGVTTGSTGTSPNLQGLFIVGAGNTSPAATGGMGNLAPGGPSGDNSAGAGLGPSHTHLLAAQAVASGGGSTVPQAVPTSSTTVTPKYYALCYIMKT
jgi:hypothetical protein